MIGIHYKYRVNTVNKIAIETSTLLLEFDKDNGSLVTIYSKISDWYIFNRPHLALSWRLMLPLEGRRNNNAWGNLQKTMPICEYTDGYVKFIWPEIDSEFGGTHRISVTTECIVENDQAVFKMHLKNDDKVIIENVYYPYVGDLHRPQDAQHFSLLHGDYFRMQTSEMWPTFRCDVGTHSVDFPTLTFRNDTTPPIYPFALAADEKGNGLYMGMTERRIEALTWHAEAHPGWRNSNDFRLFTEDQAEGWDVYNRFCLGHFPFVKPGMEFDLLPLALEAYKGGWAQGAKCYTKISRQWNKLPLMPEWARHPHAWFQIHINSPEDELRIPFRDLPKIGMECKKHGIKAVQLVGWNDGGQDRGNPSHDPDPRLGTFDELKQAIKEIRGMGIKLILFTKFTWADQTHPEFESVYQPLAIKDPYGNYYSYKGYQYHTLSQMSDINTRRLIPMCFHSDKYMEVCRREFQKCIDLGADGILYDENQHHTPTLCCFDETHGHRYGESVYAADERLIVMFREMVKEQLKDQEFLIAGEGSYDFQLNYYDVSYGRTWNRWQRGGHVPYARMVRPNANLMSAVIGFNDRSMINQCLLNRYLMSYEPFNFKGMPSDFPSTVAYGQKMDQLRTELRNYFWDGEFQDKIGGSITLEGSNQPFNTYAVYNGINGRQGMIICNYDEKNSITVQPILESGQVLTYYRLVDNEKAIAFSGSFTLPPQSAAAVY